MAPHEGQSRALWSGHNHRRDDWLLWLTYISLPFVVITSYGAIQKRVVVWRSRRAVTSRSHAVPLFLVHYAPCTMHRVSCVLFVMRRWCADVSWDAVVRRYTGTAYCTVRTVANNITTCDHTAVLGLTTWQGPRVQTLRLWSHCIRIWPIFNTDIHGRQRQKKQMRLTLWRLTTTIVVVPHR